MNLGRRRMAAGIERLTDTSCADVIWITANNYLALLLTFAVAFGAARAVMHVVPLDGWADAALGAAAATALGVPLLLGAQRPRLLARCGDEVVVAKASVLRFRPSEIVARYAAPVPYHHDPMNLVRFDRGSWRITPVTRARFERIMG